MKILDISDFVSERMKVMPITNDEFDKVKEFDVTEKEIDADANRITMGIKQHCLGEGDLFVKYNDPKKPKEMIACLNYDIVTTDWDITILWRTVFEIKDHEKIKEMFNELFGMLELKSKCPIRLFAGYHMKFHKKPEYRWIYNYSYKTFI